MKLLLVFAFLALVCMARSAPVQSTPRVLILPDYHNDDEAHEDLKPHEDEAHAVDNNEGDDDDDDDETTTTTTTTTTTRRSTILFPTRNRNVIPSRRPGFPQRTTSTQTTTPTTSASFSDDEQEEDGNEYDGDFKYIRNVRKYFKKLLDDIKKLVRNLTGYDFASSSQRPQYEQTEE